MLDVPLFDEELIGATIFAYIVYFFVSHLYRSIDSVSSNYLNHTDR